MPFEAGRSGCFGDTILCRTRPPDKQRGTAGLYVNIYTPTDNTIHMHTYLNWEKKKRERDLKKIKELVVYV